MEVLKSKDRSTGTTQEKPEVPKAGLKGEGASGKKENAGIDASGTPFSEKPGPANSEEKIVDRAGNRRHPTANV
jgi:hypothetical protein